MLTGAVCSQCERLAPFSEITVVGDKVSPVMDSNTILNYRLVCKNHALDEEAEEKLPHGCYNDLVQEYGIALESVL